MTTALQPLADKDVIHQLEDRIKTLEHQLDWFRKQIFGQKSEKRLPVLSPDQIGIESLLCDAPAEQAPSTETVTYTRKKPKVRADNCVTSDGLRFDDSVPVETHDVIPDELKGSDADQYTIIDYKKTHRLAQRPASYVVLKYRHPVIKRKTDQKIISCSAPEAVFEKSLADVSFLAGMLTDKFLYHLPLYRQHQRLTNSGITLSRTTLINLTKRSIALLKPIYDAQLANILKSRVLAIDETPIKAGRSAPGKMKQAWFWPLYGESDEMAFTFSTTRATTHLVPLLEGFEGVLLTDGYAAYDAYCRNKTGITQAQCWTHTRRYFINAEKDEPEAVAEALDKIRVLYENESHIKAHGLQGEKKQSYRAKHSKPIVDDIFAWCHKQRQRLDLTPSAPFTKALFYLNNHIEQLVVYLSDSDVPIDTNHVERNLRCIPMGRRNWLFCWTELGAEDVGVIQSLLMTCRLQGVPAYTWLVDVLQRVSQHPASRVEELTPRLWKEKFAAEPLRSDLQR